MNNFNRTTRNSLALAGTLLITVSLAQAESGPQFRDLQSQAMGRSGVASSKGATALFLNPAGLANNNNFGGGITTDIGLNSILLDYAAWAAKNYKYLNTTDSLLTKIEEVDNKWAPFSQTNLIYGNVQGTAVAVLMDTRYDLTIGKAVVTAVPGVGALSDLVVSVGRGLEAPEGYHFGFALKYYYRLNLPDRLVGTTDEAFYKVKKAWEKPDHGWSDKLKKIGVAGDIAEVKQAFGANLGIEKVVDENWNAGISLLDFPTIMDARFVRPDINLGLSYHKDLDLVVDLENKLLVNLDYQRFLIPGTPWFKQLKAGIAMEGYMKKRPVSYVALGFNDGYPTFGVRFGYILYLSYVYVAEEIGTYPGQEKLSFHKIALQLEL
jgi:hypothetical protein